MKDANEVAVAGSVDMFNVDNCKLLKTKGTTLVGFVTQSPKGRMDLTGAACSGIPTEAEFLNLFKLVSSNNAVKLNVAAENVDIMDLQIEQKVAFAGMAAKYQIVMANQEHILAGMAINSMLGK